LAFQYQKQKKYIYETPKNCGFILPKYVDNGDKTPTELVLMQ
jgi:hypothetical protein